MRQAACVLASVFRAGALDLHCRLGRVRVQVLAGPHDLLLSRAVLYWLCANLRVPGHRHYLRRVRCWSSVLVVAAALEPPASCLDALLALVQAPSWQGWAHAAVRLWGFFFSAPLALHMPSFDHVPASRTWFLACCSCKSPSWPSSSRPCCCTCLGRARRYLHALGPWRVALLAFAAVFFILVLASTVDSAVPAILLFGLLPRPGLRGGLDASGFALQPACVLASVLRVGVHDLLGRLGLIRLEALAGRSCHFLVHGLAFGCV